MPGKCFIGLDQGSSSTKAIAISEQGQVVFQIKRSVPAPFTHEERVEFDPATVVKSVQDALAETVMAVRSSGFSPAQIGLSCQRSSCLAWNEQTVEPVSPLLSWRDLRGADFVNRVRDRSHSIFEISGLPLTPYYSASKLRWLFEHLPAARNERAVLGPLSSYLVQKLVAGKKAVVDHTHAARTQLMGIRSLAWDADLLDRFQLAGARLPEIVPSAHPYGEIETPAGAVPLGVCVGDQQAAMIGLGVLGDGDGGINYGTGGFLMVNTGTELAPVRGLMASLLYSTGSARHYLLEGSVNAAGDALEWVRSLGLFAEYADLDDLCWQASQEVVFFVGLNGTGAPHWENAISSAVHGLGRESTRADIARAAVENIAFFMKDIAEEIRKTGFEPNGFSVSGGLASLTYLVQIQADLLGSEMRVSSQQEVSALGAALLAGMAHGAWDSDAIRKMTTSGETIAPRLNTGVEKRYRRWKELHRVSGEIDRVG